MLRLITIAVLASVASLDAQRPIRIYVVPVVSPSGFTDPALKRRSDSRGDLLKQLRDRRIQIVNTVDGADLSLDVLSSADEYTGETEATAVRRPGGTTSARAERVTEATVVVKLTSGDYSLDIVGRPVRNPLWGSTDGVWTMAARNAADQIKRWVRDNEKQLLAKSPQ